MPVSPPKRLACHPAAVIEGIADAAQLEDHIVGVSSDCLPGGHPKAENFFDLITCDVTVQLFHPCTIISAPLFYSRFDSTMSSTKKVVEGARFVVTAPECTLHRSTIPNSTAEADAFVGIRHNGYILIWYL